MRMRKGNLGNQNGAVFVTVALAIPLILALVLYVSHMYRVFQERARMQELADAAAVGAASMQARSLNAIALMNDTLLGIEGLAVGVFLSGNAAALVLDGLVITAPEGIALHQEDLEITRQLIKLANQVAKLQDTSVQIFEYPPLFAAQLPLLTEGLRPAPLLIPFPLPGVQGSLTLSLALPLEKRSFGFQNLMARVNDFAVAGAKDALQSVHDEFDFKDRMGEARKGCATILKGASLAKKSGVSGVVAGVNQWFGKKKRMANPGEVLVEGCKKVVTAFSGGDPVAFVGTALEKLLQPPPKPPFSAGDVLNGQDEFPPPLVLNHDYSQQYQVAVLAVRCKPWADCDGGRVKFDDFNFSIAQARAHSDSQREGGDLLVPDFSARLVPVSVLELAAASGGDGDSTGQLQTFLSEGPWAIKH